MNENIQIVKSFEDLIMILSDYIIFKPLRREGGGSKNLPSLHNFATKFPSSSASKKKMENYLAVICWAFITMLCRTNARKSIVGITFDYKNCLQNLKPNLALFISKSDAWIKAES